MVGLAETAVKESKERIRSALLNAGFEYPRKVVTINLGPADLPKHGNRYDLPIAMGILAAMGHIETGRLEAYEFMGELALNGDVKSITGILPAAWQTLKAGRQLVIPAACAREVALLKSRAIRVVSDLQNLVRDINQDELTPAHVYVESHEAKYGAPQDAIQTLSAAAQFQALPEKPLKLSDIKGQQAAKRAVAIAATGAHNLLLMGLPGAGKSMLAARLPGLLPALEEMELLELTAIRSITRSSQQDTTGSSHPSRPFRAPHHSISYAALCGGGMWPKPGEISLAHHGVLFLDEIPEFSRNVLESLREPLETGQISISRSRQQVVYPARFQLVATMNPCPCGYAGGDSDRCHCRPEAINRYRNRVSGPLLDRIDLQVDVPPLQAGDFFASGDNSDLDETVLKRNIWRARQFAIEQRAKPNAWLDSQETQHYCRLDREKEQLLEQAIDRLGISARGAYKIMRVALTISELDGSPAISKEHLLEAMSYRLPDQF